MELFLFLIITNKLVYFGIVIENIFLIELFLLHPLVHLG